jgi:hypothetical protein
MRTHYIYTLSNPNNGEVFYVGCTVNPVIRKEDHLYLPRLSHWFDLDRERLLLCGKDTYIHKYKILPDFDILEEVVCNNRKTAEDIEVYWIHQFIAWGFPVMNYKGTNRKFNQYRKAIEAPITTA